MDIGQLIRSARRRAQLSQRRLGELAGTSQSAIARYERGAAQPSVATLARLLDACGERLELRSVHVPEHVVAGHADIRRHRRELLAAARRHGGRNLRVFGSEARGEARADSDVDLLVELEPGRTLLDLVALRRDASAVLGRAADVFTPDMLREHIRAQAERDAVPV